ncbi:ankyrin repeat domain 45 [Cichlidogyrus casuarinus]|uniref:Ankyrin repeat domain 45 n=1 Tax=Cichlidogyrus casuarinus TaxID=1844966 RepID=A0ABD2QKI1_9PLAT
MDKNAISDLLTERNYCGKNLLEMYTIVDEANSLKMCQKKDLLTKDPDINGYTLLHYAAIWNRANLIKWLYLIAGFSIYDATKYGEKPIDTAKRYQNKEAIHALEWADCRNGILSLISRMRALITATDKTSFRLMKEEKKLAESSCNEHESWLNNTPDPTYGELYAKRGQLELILEPFIEKLSSAVS